MSELITKKKRGRKPKNYNSLLTKIENINITEESVNSEEEKIILHLPITLDEINDCENADMGVFIKTENDIKNPKLNLKIKSDDTDSTETLKSTIMSVTTKINCNPAINKIITHSLNFTTKTKCWWCRNCFTEPAVQLPEDYYNDTFYCIGNFCSFNCAKSHNLDINDSMTYKRESLLHLLYYQTYSENKEIVPAPHWITLDEYGGTLSIDKFRENSIQNNKEYLVLHPPLMSRQMQIEESYKFNKLKEVPIDKVNKMYSEVESEYAIRRSKPVASSQLNLETTMGLKKKAKNPFKL